ncbi:unannotated protein [freshwater metagenome]|uniref:Unannotated protein n=1 Tax=freshwater metagenome TaxID=449393 RepID=A0A6J6N0Q6_9ZZZZ
MQHALFVVDDDLRCAEVEQSLEAIVAVDHATVEIVEVAGGETTTIELHHWAQFWWDHRHDIENHCLWIIDPTTAFVALVERRNNLQTLDGLLAALCAERLAAAFWWIDGLAKLDLFDIEIDAIDELLDAVCTRATLEVIAVTIAQFAP